MVVMEDKNRGFPLKNIAWNTPTYMHKNFRPSFAHVYLALAYTRTLPSTRSKFPWLLLPHDKPCMISLFSSKENRLVWPVVCFPFNFLPLCTYIIFCICYYILFPILVFFSSSIHPLNAYMQDKVGRCIFPLQWLCIAAVWKVPVSKILISFPYLSFFLLIRFICFTSKLSLSVLLSLSFPSQNPYIRHNTLETKNFSATFFSKPYKVKKKTKTTTKMK